jgi:hypothetical protein
MEEVIRKQNLIAFYRLEDRPERLAFEQAVVALRAASDFSVTDAGLIEIAVRFGTPWLAGPNRRRSQARGRCRKCVGQSFINREKACHGPNKPHLSRAPDTENVWCSEPGDDLAAFQRTHGAVA